MKHVRHVFPRQNSEHANEISNFILFVFLCWFARFPSHARISRPTAAGCQGNLTCEILNHSEAACVRAYEASEN